MIFLPFFTHSLSAITLPLNRHADSLTKNYYTKVKEGFLKSGRREKRAVDGISFRINEGEMVGYIGPNGAGKSTTIKMLTGILLPDGGSVTVNGLDPFRDRKKNYGT